MFALKLIIVSLKTELLKLGELALLSEAEG